MMLTRLMTCMLLIFEVKCKTISLWFLYNISIYGI
ncbi:hypothetical protein NC651_003147 [Populus alba x Populus x berolinensis]|nr:hypothetical protein NC651_003147 [Populus alba x Populus x berolinensis]